MIQRLISLTSYLLKSMLFSLSGLLYILLALAFYLVLFEPRQQTPDVDYYFLVIGLFGLILSFLVTLSVCSKANKAEHFPFLVRLPSRVEYLTAVMGASLIYSFAIELAVGVLALLINGPDLGILQMLVILPVWFVVDLCLVVLALHATDLVASGWSRVYLFGVLGVLLYLESADSLIRVWFAGLFRDLGNSMMSRGVEGISAVAYDISSWLATTGADFFDSLLGLIFWPFSAITDAAVNESFSLTQSLAPAVILLYTTILFLLAASIFSKKDIFMTE